MIEYIHKYVTIIEQLVISSKVHDGDTHNLRIGARLALKSLVAVEVVLGVDPDLVRRLHSAHHGAGCHLLNVLLAIGSWAVALTLVDCAATVRVSTTHAIIGL
jgi:hypothetical protein